MNGTIRRTAGPIVLSLGVLLTVMPPQASANINMALVPITGSGVVGDVVEINLVLSSDSAVSQQFVALEAILNWNPADVLLLGFTSAHAGYAWFQQGFLTNADGLNVSTTDGDADYTALAQITTPASAPPAGLICTTFRFQLLRPAQSSPITLRAMQGQFSRSQVVGTTPGSDLTGTLTSTSVHICSNGDINGSGAADAADVPVFVNVLLEIDTLPAHVANSDVNCDGAVDALDIQALVNRIVH